jgi:pimeloyl-ACP methyl ester carboxylesterase
VIRGRLAAGLAALAVALVAPAGADGALRFRDCRGVECARLSVPLDRAGGTAGRISLYVQRRPAARRPRRGITLLLAGGPGQAATVAYEDSYRDFARLTPRNDIVAFDQRGTGRSGLLRCTELERANLVNAGAAAADCARRLGRRRGFYRTTDTVDDIVTLR